MRKSAEWVIWQCVVEPLTLATATKTIDKENIRALWEQERGRKLVDHVFYGEHFEMIPNICKDRHIFSDAEIFIVHDAVKQISGKWNIQILCLLMDRPRRFLEFKANMRKISDKVLAQQLNQMITYGLISRQSINCRWVEYRITYHGRRLSPIFAQIIHWKQSDGDRQVNDVGA